MDNSGPVFTRCKTPALFLEEAESFLLDKEIERCLVHGIALKLIDNPLAFNVLPFFAVAKPSRSVIAAAMMTPPHPLSICAAPDLDDSVLQSLADLLQRRSLHPGSVLAPYDLAERFAEIWAERTGSDFTLRRKERAFELRNAIAPVDVSGYLRLAEKLDFELIANWFLDFKVETFGQLLNESQTDSILKTVQSRIEQREFHLWVDEVAVSMAAATRPTERGITINAVYTPTEFRNKGYASACVAELSQKKLDEGKVFCSLYTDLANPTSNKIYKEIGYRAVVDFRNIELS